MPIQPIDLQNLFLRMDQIGKEQAAQREISLQHQSLQNSTLAKELEHQDHSVNQPEDMRNNLRKTDEDGGNRQRNREDGDEEEKQKNLKDRKKTTFTDPDLGHNIDITG